MIAASLKEIVLAKLRLAPCFGLQLDETTDITGKAQLIVYVRFPSTERMKIVDHYLFCLPIGIDTTALSVFSKLDNYFSEHEVMWSKCKSVSTDGPRAMVGVRSRVVALIKQVAPEVVSIHCILHREALVAKKLANEEICVHKFFLQLGGECRDSCMPNAWLQRACLMFESMLLFYQSCPLPIMIIVRNFATVFLCPTVND